ncbi:UDP-N-acetylmuramoyl-L-alanyl-D-glutamate--2,6-diaminopimelate ligase [Malonomonas rubra]|uniref:UDP-N-acetylmuramoyl-L-alanyl-D-glutamate--2, 6-diaminopimelate ligase n=1 Tax=Malonomonas rubra TaxID=57040 RepID=UPI0026EBFC19|nr:UDP-N-acetylmuramoyl-L-alanyl-D-glutamate--2,6-diaminopimelate ligase [Malonomonas rubra]
MLLSKMLKDIEIAKQYGPADVEVSGLACDSRRVQQGFAFFALPGALTDGFDFIPQATAAGAAVVISERWPATFLENVCYLQVANVRRTMALIASEYYRHPTAGIPVIGVTGTNGKTSITYLLEAVLRQAGYSPAVFGTIEYRFGNEKLESTHTTPESLELMQMMGKFRMQGADAIILEVSSHALEQHRVDGIEFDIAVFTNLTPEHLDYHQNLDNYFASKRRLFSELLGQGSAAINRDDGFGRQLLRENPAWCSFGEEKSAQVHPLDIRIGRDGIVGSFLTPHGQVDIDSGLIGHFNISNLLATVTAAQLLEIENREISAGISAAAKVPGRLEKVENDKDVLALVDYAHTGDALEQVLKTLSKLDSKRLITLVGCGGDRDPSKRPVMAAASVEYSDLSIFTSDNPRTEDPQQILQQVRSGALAVDAVELSKMQLESGEKGFVVIPDRRTAIRLAVSLAKAGDLLLLAGKGHEDYQILGTEKVHFDDREELMLAFQRTVSEEKYNV